MFYNFKHFNAIYYTCFTKSDFLKYFSVLSYQLVKSGDWDSTGTASDSGSEMTREFWVGHRLKIIPSTKAGGEKEPDVGLKKFCVHGRR